MGSKGQIPPHHLRRPIPGPGLVHPDPSGPGNLPHPGPFPPFDMLPPPEVLEQKIAAQHVEMQRLGSENQRIAATHGTLRRELAAAQHELQILRAQIGAITSEREKQMQSLTEKINKMEAELKATEPVKIELQKAHAEAQNLVLAREELMYKVHQLSQDLHRAHVDMQQLPALMAEFESLRQEYHHCRATFDYEKKFYNDHLESLKVMEKNYINMASELEKLRAELTNTTNVDSRIVGQYGVATVNNENGASGHPVGKNAYEVGYGIHMINGILLVVHVRDMVLYHQLLLVQVQVQVFMLELNLDLFLQGLATRYLEELVMMHQEGLLMNHTGSPVMVQMMHPGMLPLMHQLKLLLRLCHRHMDKQQSLTTDLIDLLQLLLMLEVHTRHPLKLEIVLGDDRYRPEWYEYDQNLLESRYSYTTFFSSFSYHPRVYMY